jgi:hypothetical protein
MSPAIVRVALPFRCRNALITRQKISRPEISGAACGCPSGGARRPADRRAARCGRSAGRTAQARHRHPARSAGPARRLAGAWSNLPPATISTPSAKSSRWPCRPACARPMPWPAPKPTPARPHRCRPGEALAASKRESRALALLRDSKARGPAARLLLREGGRTRPWPMPSSAAGLRPGVAADPADGRRPDPHR